MMRQSERDYFAKVAENELKGCGYSFIAVLAVSVLLLLLALGFATGVLSYD